MLTISKTGKLFHCGNAESYRLQTFTVLAHVKHARERTKRYCTENQECNMKNKKNLS